MKRIAVYAGSFDPPTLGHLWMMQQGCKLFDELVVVQAINPDKKGFFSPEEKRAAMESLRPHLPENVIFHELASGFLVEYAQRIGASYLLRGIRNTLDFEYEKSIARINAQMVPELQTVFLAPPPELENISSSFVRGFVGNPGWENWVRPHVTEEILQLMISRTKSL